ncbi:hypothetical protein IJI55_00600 [Candidatus Saccharibacteria bacterium]|nr:hypothetical protein [Candidatus Saccharibacteria bacterium]
MKNKKQTFIIISLIVLLIISIVSITLFIKLNDSQNTNTLHIAGEEINEKSVLFENRQIIDNFIPNKKLTGIILENIQSTILQEDSINTAPHANYPTNGTSNNIYTASFSLNGLSTEQNQDYPTISLKLSISDGRIYQVYIRTDSNNTEFIATLIKNQLSSIDQPQLYINAQNESYNTIIEEWSNTIVKNTKIIYSNLGYAS